MLSQDILSFLSASLGYACLSASLGYACLIRLRNSFLVLSSLRNTPEKADVVVIAFAFWIPLICMQVCDASITTATPNGLSVS